METHLPKRVIAFLNGHVDHVVKLELLVALHDAPSRLLSVPVAARTLDVPRGQVRDMAQELEEEGLARVSGDRMELSPISIEDRMAISELAGWYARDRAVVLDLLRAMGKCRS